MTTNDSGDTGRVFTVDPVTGKTVGVTDWADDPTTWRRWPRTGTAASGSATSATTPSRATPCRSPTSPSVAPAATSSPRSTTSPIPTAPHDAETLMRDPATGRLYVATQGPLSAASCSRCPAGDGRMRALGDVLPLATDGAFLARRQAFVIRNYAVAAVYAFPSLEKVDQFPASRPAAGRGDGGGRDGTLLFSSEGLHAEVLRVSLPTSTAPCRPPQAASPRPPRPSLARTPLPETPRDPAAGLAVVPGGLIGLGCLVVLLVARSPMLRRR